MLRENGCRLIQWKSLYDGLDGLEEICTLFTSLEHLVYFSI